MAALQGVFLFLEAFLGACVIFFGTIAVMITFGVVLRSYLLAKSCKDKLARIYKNVRYSVTQ